MLAIYTFSYFSYKSKSLKNKTTEEKKGQKTQN